MAKRNLAAQRDAEFAQLMGEKVAEVAGRHTKSKARTNFNVMVRNQTFLDGLETLMENNPLPKAGTYKGKKAKKPQRILNLMLSDLHYGADVSAAETGDVYGPVEEARRTASVCLAAADWKRQYRKETVLYVHILGDIIEGKLHDPETGAPMAEQFYRATWNLTQGLRFLASEFQEVCVFAVPGNHGRRKDRHPGRAVNQKWDSIENMLYASLKMALAAVPNVKFTIPMTPYYRYDAFNKRGFMTHGDTVLNVGFPGRAINVESVRRQVNEINAREHCDLYGVGHVHVASSVRIPSGPVLITNGCLVPSGEFGESLGMMNVACCQQIWESVPDIIYGHRMDILVDRNTDKEADLDRIVTPFPGPEKFGNGGR